MRVALLILIFCLGTHHGIFPVLGSIPITSVITVPVTQGDFLQLECSMPKSVPAATVNWALRDPDDEDSLTPLSLGKRVQMDQKGWFVRTSYVISWTGVFKSLFNLLELLEGCMMLLYPFMFHSSRLIVIYMTCYDVI